MRDADLRARLELAVSAGRGAGSKTLKYFCQAGLQVDRKQDGTPVTAADREAELWLRSEIDLAFPDDGILGEEYPEREGRSGFRWILDPIDGTKSFVQGVPLYGTLVGVEYEERCVIGVVVLPGLDEYVYAARGHGCWHAQGSGEPRPAQVSSVKRLSDAAFCTTSVSAFVKANRQAVYDRLLTDCRLTRGWGDCYGYVLVATGRAEIMIDPELSIWDMAPLPVILEEAGGTFTDFQGNATIYNRQGLATNGHLLDAVLAITRDQ